MKMKMMIPRIMENKARSCLGKDVSVPKKDNLLEEKGSFDRNAKRLFGKN